MSWMLWNSFSDPTLSFPGQDTGGFGRFQWILLALSLVASFSCAFNHLSPVFTAFSPPFTCSGDGGGTPLSGEELCLAAKNRGSSSDGSSDLCIDGGELTFNKSVMHRTVVTDFGLVCDQVGRVPVITSSYMAGVRAATG